MKYLKVWVTFRKALEPYSDAEKGRLFDAMLAYAADGTEPHFSGNERYIWGSVKETIDLTRETSEKRKAVGALGGTAAAENREAANDSKTQQNIANDSKTDQPIARGSRKEKKRKEKKLIDDDDDVYGAHDEYENAVLTGYQHHVGRKPSPEELASISAATRLSHMEPALAEEAVRIAAGAGALNVAAYARKVIDDWDFEEVRTMEEAAEYRFDYSRDDKETMAESRRRRKAEHGGQPA